MGIRLHDLLNERREVRVKTSLGDLKVVYRPNALTPADLSAYANLKGVDMVKAEIENLANTVVEWDLVGPLYDRTDNNKLIVEEDTPVPLKKEILQYVPTSILGAVMKTILEDAAPKSPPSTSETSHGLYSEPHSFN